MQKFKRSWWLFKSSVLVIAQNKRLLVFPLLSFVLTVLIVLFCVTPVAFMKTGYHYDQAAHWKAVSQTFFTTTQGGMEARPGSGSYSAVALKPLGFVLTGTVYLLCVFLATFFNAAFFHQIMVALKGGRVSVTAGLRFAISKLPSIFLWSLLAGAVGLVIKSLEEKVGFLGQLVLRFLGAAWSVASVFAIPVLIVEPGTNPFAVLRQSAATIRKTWGESLIGYVGIQFGSFLVLLASILFLAGAGVLAMLLHNFWILAGAGVLWVLGLVAFAYLSSVAAQVYRCALFLYAAEGLVADPFDPELFTLAWKVKQP